MTRPPASSSERAKAPLAFKDGLGTRERAADAGGDAIEHLHLCQDVAAQESAIRDRVGRLVNFRHARYVRLRGVDRAKTGTRALYVAYDALEGHRLSQVLEALPKSSLSIDVDVALQIIRDLLPAIGILHDSRKVTHGCIAPERLVYTSQQRLVIVDHGLGAALQRMNLPRKRLWDQFRIASPAPNKAVFDEKMDIVQIGLVALALMLGRPLTDEEYPAQIKRLIFSIKEQSTRIGSRPIGPELRRWLERATGVDEAQTFTSIKEAQDAFEGVVAVDRYAPTAAAVKAFFQRFEEFTAKTATAAAADERGTRAPGANLDLDSALSEMQIQVKVAPRRRAADSTPTPAAPATRDGDLAPAVSAEAVEFKLPGAAKKAAKPEPAAVEADRDTGAAGDTGQARHVRAPQDGPPRRAAGPAGGDGPCRRRRQRFGAGGHGERDLRGRGDARRRPGRQRARGSRSSGARAAGSRSARAGRARRTRARGAGGA
jgi:hypothetical protein